MSIIIRLQNLPLNAKSGDIRNFFGGLRIPDGGVHILGGEKGDAFIAFMSDEDARLAMRKDGGKIKDSRVKLFLSSRMEMQHAVEKITRNNFADAISPEMFSTIHSNEVEALKNKSSEKRKRSRSQSPHKHKERISEKSRSVNEYRHRSRSPIGERMYSSRGSPKRVSRSPKRHLSTQRSSPPKYKTSGQGRRSVSPKATSYGHTTYEKESRSGIKHSEHPNSERRSLSQSELQAELERRITEELEKNEMYRMIVDQEKSSESNSRELNLGVGEDFSYRSQDPYQQNFSSMAQDMSFLPPNNNILPVNNGELFTGFYEDFQSKSMIQKPENWYETFYVTLSGLDPQWNFREVQIMLKGIFAPQNNIKFERDHAGYKTGRAFLKLTNKDDFDSILRKRLIFFNGHEIEANECPIPLCYNFFPDVSKSENFSQNYDLCYTLKGLPFSCTYDDVINFFYGFEIADLIISYGPDGRATGTGYVSFCSRHDFEGAMSQNGKKILHRYIELIPCSQNEMIEAKKGNLSSSFTPYSKLMLEKKFPDTRRPLCALLTGLSYKTTATKIYSFFSESGLKPDAIHLTLNKRHCDGRAFVEFTNFLDFDLALKFHGKTLGNNIICVKQILYDEMVKILDSQRARHYFNSPTPAGPNVNVPEKVPYLWEPPDADEELNEVQTDNDSKYKNKLQERSVHSDLCFKDKKRYFAQNVKVPYKKYFGSLGRTPVSTKTVDTLPSMVSNNYDLNPFDNKASYTANSVKEPIHFNITADSIREPMQFDINKNVDTKTSELFNSLKKYEDNIKTSRLSPENEAALLEFLKSKKGFNFGLEKERSKSPDRRRRNFDREGSLERTKADYKSDKSYKSRSTDESRNRSERDSRYWTDFKSESGTPLQTDKEENEVNAVGCVVHLSNVSISAGTGDLANFLKGFDYFENTLIRRYTMEGMPTEDVRVTFLSIREAERAVRTLDKQYLYDMPVRLYIL